MPKFSILRYIKELRRTIFTTQELSFLSGKSLSATTQALNFLWKQKIIMKIYRGIWAEIGDKPLSPYSIIPFLLPKQQIYVSFTSALHLYGIIEQIPQVISLASITHTKIIRTNIAVFHIHQISPYFFSGFDWYKDSGDFLIAEQEKALIDCLYLSARKKRQFGYFPEMDFPKSFSFKKAKEWVSKIPDAKIRISVCRKLDSFC